MLALQATRSSLFWVSVPIFFINFALPVKSKALGASALEIGGLFSLFTLSLLLFRPLIGILLDRYGRKRFLLLALLLYSCAYAGFGFATEVTWMYAARFLQGLGAALLLLSVDAITTDLAEVTERAEALGKNFEAQARSTFVGATIGFTLIAIVPDAGWRISFFIFMLLAVYALVVALRFVPETAPVKSVEIDPTGLSMPMLSVLVLLVPLGFVSAMMMPIYLVYLQDMFQPDVRWLSWAFLPAGLVFALLPSKFGAIVDRYGAVAPCAIGLALASGLYVLLPVVDGFWAVVAVYTCAAFCWAVIEPARKAMTAQVSGSQIARGFGLAEMSFGLGAVAGPLVGGYLYDHVDHALPFFLNCGVMLVSVVILLLLVRPKLVAQGLAARL
tara:strand:+ start:186 stop:1346 length:1161 start_codon:yes stop_codon:yes gene_type:complete